MAAAGQDLVPRIDKLNAKNYPLWKFAMNNYIRSKSWHKLISGEEEEGEDFDEKDAKCKTAIAMTLDQEHLAMVIHCQTAKEMWETLVRIREQSTDTNRMLLQFQYMEYKYRPGQSISEFVSGLNVLSTQLKSLGKEVDETDFISKILHELPREYDNFRTNWRLIASENAEMMTREKFTGHLLAAESSVGKDKKHTEAFFVQKKSHQKKTSKSCFNCGKPGHFARDCRLSKAGASGEKKDGNQQPGHQKQNKFQKKGNTHQKGFMAHEVNEEGDVWIADGGCTLHLTRHRRSFASYTKLENPITIWTADKKIQAIGKGTVQVRVFDGESWCETVLHEVHHVPDLGCQNLFSEGQAMDRFGYEVKKTADRLYIMDGDRCCLVGQRNEGSVWILKMETIIHQANAAGTGSMRVWHERLGHVGTKKLVRMEKHESAIGFTMKGSEEFNCTGCAKGKMPKLPTKRVKHRSHIPGERLSADVCGPMQVESLGGCWYFLLIKDEASCFRSIYFLKTKEAAEILKWLKTHIKRSERQTGNKVKVLRTDRGKEFENEMITSFLNDEGILYETTIGYSPNMNGIVERDNRTIMERVKCMCYTADLPLNLWAELANTAVYLMNRTPNREEQKTPFELWHGHKPHVGHLRIIGSETHVHVPKQLRKKLDAVSWQGILVGYGRSNQFYRVYNPEKDEVAVAKDVRIFEKVPDTELLLDADQAEDGPKHKVENKSEDSENSEPSLPTDSDEEDKDLSDYDSEAEHEYEKKAKQKVKPFHFQLRGRKEDVNYRDKESDEEDDDDDFHEAKGQMTAQLTKQTGQPMRLLLQRCGTFRFSQTTARQSL